MKAVLTTLGKFHSFDLARQLHARAGLEAIYTGYPRFKLHNEALPAARVRCFPYVHAPYMASGWRHRFGTRFLRAWEYLDRVSLDQYVARTMPDADVFVGLSGCGLASGRRAHARGMRVVCDRGSTHIRWQDEAVREAHERFGLRWDGIDPRIVEREEAEYAQADAITVPSHFVRRSFIERGVPAEKLHVIPYGVDLRRFHAQGRATAGRCDLLFVGSVGLRKGVPDLLEAFHRLAHPHKSLTIAGMPDPGIVEALAARGLLDGEVRLVGHVPQAELKGLMSRSHALLLPSLEEGLALVMAQAMACGCPVVATPNAGAETLYDHEVEGLVVPPRDVPALVAAMERIAEPALQERLREASLQRVRSIGGWDAYGAAFWHFYDELRRPPTRARTGGTAAVGAAAGSAG